MYKVGDEIEARSSIYPRRWLPGKILKASSNGYMHISFDNNSVAEKIHHSMLRKSKALTHRMVMTKYPDDHLARPRLNFNSRRNKEKNRSTSSDAIRTKGRPQRGVKINDTSKSINLQKSPIKYRQIVGEKKTKRRRISSSSSSEIEEIVSIDAVPTSPKKRSKHAKVVISSSRNREVEFTPINTSKFLDPHHVLLAGRPGMTEVFHTSAEHKQKVQKPADNKISSRGHGKIGGSEASIDNAGYSVEKKAEIRNRINELKIAKTNIESTIQYLETEILNARH